MSFESLEKRLRDFFQKISKKNAFSKNFKQNLRIKTLDFFVQKNQRKNASFWHKLFFPKISLAAFSVIAFFVILDIFPFNNPEISAGKILQKYGPVEVIRNNDVILVKGELALEINDIIRVGNNAEAELNFPKKFVSVAKNKTNIHVVKDDYIFLENGEIENKVMQEAEIATDRGIVKIDSKADFKISVSESGETKIINKKTPITIFDWKNGHKVLKEKEEVLLRTDTTLTNKFIPADLKLSSSQKRAIQAKLDIARTKALTGVEKFLLSQKQEAEQDFLSANKTFRSIAQILNTTRNLQITTRKNINLITLEEIFSLLNKKTKDETLLAETKAVEKLLTLIAKNKYTFSFAASDSGFLNFDRFVLLENIFAIDATEMQHGNILKKKYLIAFLNKFQNQIVKINQFAIMNESIEKLPHTDLAKTFLTELQQIVAPDLKELIAQEIQNF